ncbi:polysaccharide lyase family 8 super-sandwich domain-containing protein [Ruania alba]|uniref:Hyaluronate lyase n=1 Tax=Ruania alba TaxID=648782 RepID=A0A1H5FYB1_9MICO|nr:polysaccharide lyase family 8 super-sandwich domain-containing protein [Ruania alba]SEE08430.1 hyaluronate lyase [Ruania alba]
MRPRRTQDHSSHPVDVPFSRRRLLQLSGAAASGIWIAGNTTVPAAAETPEDFAGVRSRWRDMLTGGDELDPELPEVRVVLDRLDRAVERHLPSMDRSAGRTFLWSDRDFTGTPRRQSIHLRQTYERLRQLALAYATRGAARQGDPELLEAIVDGLDWMYEHKYNESFVRPRPGNWYNWEIGAPLALTPAVLLILDQLDAERLGKYMGVVDFMVPEPTMTGANLIWQCQIIATRAALVEDSTKLTMARDAVPGALEIVTAGDGFYTDGSFIQHRHHPYTGGYGRAMLKSMSRLLFLLADSPWALRGEGLANLLWWVEDGFEPWLHLGAFMSAVRGRSISRRSSSDHDAGQTALLSLMWLAHSADPERAEHLRGVVRHAIAEDHVGNLFDTTELSSITEAVRIADDSTIRPEAPVMRNKQYPNMDRVVHRRPGFTFALAMSSSRIYTYESINDENLRGWHTGSGMQYLYNDDLAHYDEGFWATVDHTRLPGTTVPVGELAPGSGSNHLSDKSRVGGVSIGTLGVSGMEFRTFSESDWQSAPTGMKSWFMFDDQIAVLGAGITSSSGQVVESIAENRRLVEAGQRFVLDGADQGTDDWETVVDNPSWAHLTGSTATSGIGYVFTDASAVHAKRESRIDSWAAVNTNSSYVDDTPITDEYLTLWFDHGTDPSDATYAYTLLPGADADTVRRYARRPDLEVIANTADIQAVRRGGTLGANFWHSGAPAVNGVTCTGSASVLIVQDGSQITVAVADPTHGAITIDNSVAELEPRASWRTSRHLSGYHGRDYAFAEPGQDAPVARWNPGSLDPGSYTVEVWLPEGDDKRSAAASYRVHHGGQVTTFSIDQQATGGAWVTGISELAFTGDGAEYVELVVNDAEASGADRTFVVADAVRLRRVRTGESTIQLRLPRAAQRVIDTDDRIRVESMQPITLGIDLAETDGSTVQAVLEMTP